jgi:DNA-binding NarL/FixJ family response regulator
MLLQEYFPDAVISECADFDSLVAVLKKETIDLLICDVKMPGGNNFKIIEVIRFYNPEIKVLIFSALKEENYAMRFLGAGANGYIQKDREEKELVQAIKTVMEKGRYISQALSEQLMADALSGKRPEPLNPLSMLSDRELEIASLLLQGHTLGEISGMLHIQSSTVSTYKSRLYEKLKVTQLTDLIHIFAVHNSESA